MRVGEKGRERKKNERYVEKRKKERIMKRAHSLSAASKRHGRLLLSLNSR